MSVANEILQKVERENAKLRARVAELESALAKREAVAVELPAALVVTAEGSHHDYYAEGWNDCRRKVRELAASQQAAKGGGT